MVNDRNPIATTESEIMLQGVSASIAKRRDEIPPFLLCYSVCLNSGICFKIVIYSKNNCIELVFDGIDFINNLDLI